MFVASLAQRTGWHASWPKTDYVPSTRLRFVQRRQCRTRNECQLQNRLTGKAAPTRPGEVLISDITYVATTEGWIYLAVTLDLFSRQVAGWHMAESMETDLVLNAASKASSRLGAGGGTVYHSDRGCQYTSSAMRNWLRDRGIIQSMSAAGYCYDNATCESFLRYVEEGSLPAGLRIRHKG